MPRHDCSVLMLVNVVRAIIILSFFNLRNILCHYHVSYRRRIIMADTLAWQ